MNLTALLPAAELAAARWSIAVRSADGEFRFEHQALELLPSASLAKVFLLIELAARIEAGDLDAEELIERSSVPPVADSGLWQHLRVPALSIGDLAVLVGATSDNLATNALLGLVGLPAVQRRAADLAPGGSMLLDCVRDERTAAHPPSLSRGCAADWAGLFGELAAGRLLSPGVSARVRDWLAPGLDLSLVGSALGLDPLAHAEPDRGLALINKTGTDRGVRADAGVLSGPTGRLSYAVLCHWDESADSGARDLVLEAMRAIGAELRRAVGG